MAFEGLTEKLSNVFKKLRGKGRLSEADVKEAMKEIRMALLEADVSYKVVKEFTKMVTERAIGADVLESLTPAQMIVKIVNEELTSLMGGDSVKLNLSSKPPTVVMVVGLLMGVTMVMVMCMAVFVLMVVGVVVLLPVVMDVGMGVPLQDRGLHLLLAVDGHCHVGAHDAAGGGLPGLHPDTGEPQAVHGAEEALLVLQQLVESGHEHVTGRPHIALQIQGFHVTIPPDLPFD